MTLYNKVFNGLSRVILQTLPGYVYILFSMLCTDWLSIDDGIQRKQINEVDIQREEQKETERKTIKRARERERKGKRERGVIE